MVPGPEAISGECASWTARLDGVRGMQIEQGQPVRLRKGMRITMIETMISMELPAGEHLAIRRNRIQPAGEEKALRRISLVSGIHGDELEGQYICYETARRVNEHPEYLQGIVDIYPALNPLGIDMASRTVPRLNMDMNRMFPGDVSGDMMERITAAVVDSIIGSDICVDLHASDIFVREIPQVRLSGEFAEALLPYAKMTNVDMIWMNATATVHESTLAHSLNLLGVPTLVLEMGQGHDIHRSFGNQVVDGIFHIMSEMGIWSGPESKVQEPAVSSDGEVEFIRSNEDGVFLPLIEHNHYVKKGDLIGEVVDPFEGTVKQQIRTEHGGLLFTLRAYPVVYEGDLLARILTDR